MKHWSTVLFGISVLAAACQYDPYAGDLTTTKPKLSDIPGVYKFVEQTVNGSKFVQGYIVLNANGTYTSDSLPNVTGGPKPSDFISSKGSWELTTVGSSDTWRGIKSIWGIHLTNIEELYSSIGLSGSKPPYGLLLTVGDPDEGAVVIFKKVR